MATFPPLCQVFKQGAERARGGKRHAMHSCGKQEKGGGGFACFAGNNITHMLMYQYHSTTHASDIGQTKIFFAISQEGSFVGEKAKQRRN